MFLFSAMLDCSFPSFFPPSSFSPASIPAFLALYAHVSVGGRAFFCFFSIAFLFRRGWEEREAERPYPFSVVYTCPFVDRISTKCIQFKIAVHLTCVFFSHVVNFYIVSFFCMLKHVPLTSEFDPPCRYPAGPACSLWPFANIFSRCTYTLFV